jgi:hypothetical protein
LNLRERGERRDLRSNQIGDNGAANKAPLALVWSTCVFLFALPIFILACAIAAGFTGAIVPLIVILIIPMMVLNAKRKSRI